MQITEKLITTGVRVLASLVIWFEQGQWRDSVSSTRVNPNLNGYIEKSGESKQEVYVITQDG